MNANVLPLKSPSEKNALYRKLTERFAEAYNRSMLVLSLIFSLMVASASPTNIYTLADLEVLTQEGNFDEFFQHARDIRPAERLDAWKGMLSKMADAYARGVLSKNDVKKDQFSKIEDLFHWPSLRTDDIFRNHRQEIGLKYLKECLKAARPCWSDVKKFWESDSSNPEIALKLAELTLHLSPKKISTWTFLEVAAKSPLSEFYCKKDFVLDSIWGKLEIDYIRLGEDGNFLKKIDETIHHDCLLSFNNWTQGKLLSPDKASDRELAYQILEAQGKTNSEISDFFYTVYLLETPSKGDIFNIAWNRLTELSKSASRREEVLKRIRKLDPLPDELFGSSDLTKKKAILLHFKSKFPEYLQFYTNQCLLFYQGKTEFKQGNPTMKCQNLMGLEGSKEILGAEKVDQFNKILRF